MRYKELITFEPINEVVKFDQLSDEGYRRSLVRNFVFSETYEKTVIPTLCRDLDYTASEDTFGLQVVGNYGTGKSHLMSLVSLIAEDSALLGEVRNERARRVLTNIAGRYKVIRFELGTDEELWRVICYQIDKSLEQLGVGYRISEDDAPDMYSDKLRRMMAHFEERFPDKGLMVVIDEMLSYLKGRATGDKLNRDLSVLQALGQTSDRSKFRMMFGVQELIYKSPEFQYAADMLSKVNDRFTDIVITKQDVQFVVQERLLKKTDEQRAIIRRHLTKFTSFFTDMHAKLEDYVSLFPVNPSFFENFQLIRTSKSQREVLKTLTGKFQELFEKEVPEGEPGLICYDHYWDNLQAPDMQTDADVRRITSIMEIVHQKIDENFTGARKKSALLAHRIANACAVKILQDALDKTNGVSADNLVDDLCYMTPNAMDREMLRDIVDTTAGQIVKATVGQYFEKNAQNQEYHLRVEGGVNYEQKIKDYVNTMGPDALDSYFFNYLVGNLPIDGVQYSREFKIFPHQLEWKSHKVSLNGYIFLGCAEERSTTQPELFFYIYFLPIFNRAKIKIGTEPDSVYIRMDKFGDEFRQLISLYAASEALIRSVDTSQKSFYEHYRQIYESKLSPVFQREFLENTEIFYEGELRPVSLSDERGSSKEQTLSDVCSKLLEENFCSQLPHYPSFDLLRMPMTSENRGAMLKGAKQKIAKPGQPNRDAEAILAALGLYAEGELSIEGSEEAQTIMKMLEDKGEGQVLNRDEILYPYYKNIWRRRGTEIDADLEFLVLCTMVGVGEIEISLPGNKTVNAANIGEITALPEEMAYSFSHIRRPKGINLALVREIFKKIVGHDLTRQLDNKETFAKLSVAAKLMTDKALRLGNKVSNGIMLERETILSASEGSSASHKLKSLSGFCDLLQHYETKAKMSNLPWTLEELKQTFEALPLMEKLTKTLNEVEDLRSRISYLTQAFQYMTDAKMKSDVGAAIGRTSEVRTMLDDEKALAAYKQQLDEMKGQYADWYLAEYKRLHITGLQEAEKNKILNSDVCKLCETVCSADHGEYISIKPQYNDWSRRMSQMTLAQPTVTREAVLNTPYHMFNPTLFVGKELPKMEDMRKEIDEIWQSINQTLHEMAEDPQLADNATSVLDESEQMLFRQFREDKEYDLAPVNAQRLMEILHKLHKGIQKAYITVEDLRLTLNRPMTPLEAKKAFGKFIDMATNMYGEENVRVILK